MDEGWNHHACITCSVSFKDKVIKQLAFLALLPFLSQNQTLRLDVRGRVAHS